MHREYDLFEKFSDGSSIWRTSVFGLESARIRLRELAQKSGNQFFAINIVSGKIVHSDLERVDHDVVPPQSSGMRSKSAAT